MITVEEAKEIISKNLSFIRRIEDALAEEAAGKVLSEDIICPLNLPAFDQSAVDGYGIQAECQHIPGTLQVMDEVKAGSSQTISLNPGQAIRIFTGAPVPPGVNCIVMQEHVEVHENMIKIKMASPKAGDNIRYEGTQIKQGEIALRKGLRINPASVGLLNAMGISMVKIFCSPQVHLVITGNEIQQPGAELTPGKVYDSNSGILKTALSLMKIKSGKVVYAEDDYNHLKNAIDEALPGADLLIISGGISAGKYDMVKEALEEASVVTLFHKVAQKPGKPLYFGRCNDTLIFALPGNPAALLTCFYEYVFPALRKMQGYKSIHLMNKKLPILKEVIKKKELSVFLKAKVHEEGIAPLEGQESNVLTSFSEADAFIYLPGETEIIHPGQEVEVHILPEY